MLFTLSLPGRHGQTMQVFNALARLLPDTARTNDRTATSDVYELPIDYHPSGHVAGDEQFGIRIRVDPDAARAHFAAQAEHVTIPFDGYLQDREETARAMPDFASVCDRLQNHVHHFDHIGINVPAEIRQEDWCWPLRRVTGGGYLYEYPAGMDGYDPRENLWLFAVRNTERHLRPSADAQTKFEFVHDRASPDSLVQIDVQTDLSRTQAENCSPKVCPRPVLRIILS
ncbi:MAG: hypothetical protein H6865_01425 [Rhodospirillales bacterium]|nr:hypothetical protein [Rhodospirillales bacterium]